MKIKSDYGGINLIEVIISFIIISIISLTIIIHSYYATTELKNVEIANNAKEYLSSYTEELQGRLKYDFLSAQEMTGGRKEIILYNKRNKLVKGILSYESIKEKNVPETTDIIDWYEIKTNIEWKDLFNRKRNIPFETIQSIY